MQKRDFSDWDTYVDPIMGNCFTFNKGSHRMSNRAGPYYGLRVVLKTNISDYLLTSDAAGMRVMIHDQNDWPFPDIFGYNLKVGAATSVGVTYVRKIGVFSLSVAHTERCSLQQSVSRLGDPYSDCTDAKPSGYLYDLDYTIEGCQRSQYQALMVAACGCYDPTYPQPSDASIPLCTVDKNCKQLSKLF